MTPPEREQSVFDLARGRPEFLFGSIMALATVLPVVGLLVIFLVATPMRDELALASDGATTQGTIVRKELRSRGPYSQPRHYVAYEFRAPDGRPIRASSQVDASAYDRLVEGAPVEVEYLPSDPTVNRLVDGSTRWLVLVPSIVAPILLVNLGIAGVALARAWRAAFLQHRLLRDGVEAPGRVTKIARAMLRVNKRQMYRVHYAYQDSLGRPHAGTSAMMPEDEARSWHPDDVGAVRYDPHRPAVSIWVGQSLPAED